MIGTALSMGICKKGGKVNSDLDRKKIDALLLIQEIYLERALWIRDKEHAYERGYEEIKGVVLRNLRAARDARLQEYSVLEKASSMLFAAEEVFISKHMDKR